MRDFLAKDGNVLRVYESDNVQAVVADQSTSSSFSLTSQAGTDVFHTLQSQTTPGFSYVQLPDPYAGAKVIKQVTRSDGKIIPLDNAWTSKSRNKATNPPGWFYYVNFFDVNSTGQYSVHMGNPDLGPVPPVLQFIADQTTYEGNQTGFLVQASDLNNDPVTITAAPLPSGAQLTSPQPGQAFFNWTPQVGQAGTYTITFTASDGSLSTSQSMTIQVNSASDTDGDGMDDAWEMANFGTLDRDGTGDYDGDGISDYDEYINGTDPTRPPGPGKPWILAPDAGSEVTSLQPSLVVINAPHPASATVTYEFEVYTDDTMTTLVTSTQGVAETLNNTTWIVAPALADNTWFTWRARAFDGTFYGEWVSGSFFVNTINDAPGPITISRPVDGTWVDTFTPILEVTNSTDVDGDVLTYGFEVYSDITLTASIASVMNLATGANGATSWTLDQTLTENTWVFWQATVTDEHGAQTPGPVASFFVNTVNDAPSAPTINVPATGVELLSVDVEMGVNNGIDPENEPVYTYFELDKMDTFDSPAKQSVSRIPASADGLTRWAVTGLSDNTWYTWRAKASDDRADSAWVTGRFFVNTTNDAPAVPTPDNPGQNSWVGQLDPLLVVNPATDIDEDTLSYEFEIYKARKNGTLRRRVAFGSSLTTSWLTQPTLPKGGRYAWTARAIDEHGLAGNWMDHVFFYADEDGINDTPRIRLRKLKINDNGDTVSIRWQDGDPDSNARISLYYDTDDNGADGTLIINNLAEDPDKKADQYLWDITPIPAGAYYVYAVIDDGNTQAVNYAPNYVLVGDGGGKPFIELTRPKNAVTRSVGNKLRIKWNDVDADSNATIALYWDTDNLGFDGTLIIAGIDEDPDGRRNDSYKWRLPNTLAPGTYYIYAIITDGTDTYQDYAPGTLVVVP